MLTFQGVPYSCDGFTAVPSLWRVRRRGWTGRTGLRADQSWPARSLLLLAVYHEHLVPLGTPCQVILSALDDAVFADALHLNEAEKSFYRVLAAGWDPHPVSNWDGLRYMFSTAAQACGVDLSMVSRRNAAVNALAVALGA